MSETKNLSDLPVIVHGGRNAAKCRHFNGTIHDRCEAGVAYELVALAHDPIEYRSGRKRPDGTVKVEPTVYAHRRSIPCLGPDRNFGGASCCRYAPFTAEEIASEEAEFERTFDLMKRGLSSCCEAPFDERAVITSGRHQGHGPRYCSKCGKLAFMV